MELDEIQRQICTQFAALIETNTAEYGLARLMEQCGQVAEALITRGSRSVEKEMADVLLVFVCLACKEGIRLESLVAGDILRRTASTYLAMSG